MGWVKLDDGFFLNAKALAAGRDGRDVYLASLCWSSQQLTDGIVPAHTLPIIGALCGVTDIDQAASRLVDVGLWENHVDGWIIHDYLDWQQSKEDREEWLRRDRERKRRAREAAREPAPVATKRSDVSENVRADGERNPNGVRAIDKSPVEESPVEQRSSSSVSAVDFSAVAQLGIGTTTTTSSEMDPRADRALRIVASRLAATAANPAAYRASIVRNGSEHLEALQRLARADHQADPDELADRHLAARTQQAAQPPEPCGNCKSVAHRTAACPIPPMERR